LDEPTLSALRLIEGRETVSVSLGRPAKDLRIALADSYSLEVFCDEDVYDPEGVNYRFFCGDTVYVVRSGSRISVTRGGNLD
jgi:hypothetical protein